MYFEIIGEIEEVETIAIGGNIRDIMRIQKQYGPGRWRKLKGTAKVRLESMAEKKSIKKFALCIENKDSEDLEKRKIYQVLPDEKAEKEGYLRIIDESGEDYLYPQSYFIIVQLSREAQEALQAAR